MRDASPMIDTAASEAGVAVRAIIKTTTTKG
ncbi:MAG: hypothetical protein RLZ58_1290 [Pseudomonadota bacterium]|jgi:hypothetical protein